MTINEYQNVKDFSYEEYCGYLNKKYGAVPRKYGSSKNKHPDDGLFIHHVREDEVASLSNRKIALANDPVYQEPENLVYCNYLEHLLLHIMIGEETVGTKNLGLNGPFVFIVPALKNYFEKGWKNEKINAGYYNAIEGNKEVYDILLKRYNKIVCDTDIVLEHNSTLYPQVEDCLNNKNKALVVLGTGLGKTTTALQYIWKNQCRALVIGPNKLIKSGWERYAGWCDTITYQAFANKYDKINYDRYGLVILDEAHHAGYDEASGKGAEVWSRGINYLVENGIKLLGLTATPKRSDGIDICDTIFEGCVCEGKAVEDAIEEGIIHPFSYVTAIYNTDEIIDEYRDCENAELVGQLNLAINNTPTMKEIFNKYMPKNKRKGIIFIQEISDKPYVIDIFKDIYPDIEYRAIDSLMDPEIVSANRKWFEETDEGYLLAINMISEGAHYKGVNTLIMFRRTNSYLVYTQQLGRIITLAKDENPEAIVFDLVNNVDNVEYNDRKIEGNKRYSVSRVLDAIRRRAEKSEQIIVADETRDIVKAIRDIKQFNDDYWEDWEIEILRENYNKGLKFCVDLVNKKRKESHLKERSIDSVRTFANRRLGLHCAFKGVYMIDSNTLKVIKYFEKISDAAQLINGSTGGICQCLKGKCVQYKGFCWCREEIYFDGWVPIGFEKIRKKSIFCFETNKVYKSAKEASEETGANIGKILRCCNKKEKHASGMHFCFQKDKDEFIIDESCKHKKRELLWSQEEIDLLKQKFSILGECEELFALFPNRTKTAILGKAYKLNLKYIGSNKHNKRVICIETGNIFDSINDAKLWCGVSISPCLTGRNKSAGRLPDGAKLHWKYVEEGDENKDE